MHDFTDLDIIQFVKYSYMDISNKKDYRGYMEDIEFLIDRKIQIGDTDMLLNDIGGEGKGKKKQDGRFNFREILVDIKRNKNLNPLILIGHINDNIRLGNANGTGLVAFAFKDVLKNKIYFLCRGSEGEIFSFVPDFIAKIKEKKWLDILQSEDWRDNFNMISNHSVCFKPLKKFVLYIMSEFGDSSTKYSAFGHSKGGGLAIYLASAFEGMDGAAVDGVGLPVSVYIEDKNIMTNLQKSGMRNIIADNDIVGRMLLHFEKREYVKMKKSFLNESGKLVNPNEIYAFAWAHYPDAIFTDLNDSCVLSDKKCFLPEAVSILNRIIMSKVLFEMLSTEEKKENEEDLLKLMEKSINILESISQNF